MLFNSYAFIGAFLPATMLLYWVVQRYAGSVRLTQMALIVASAVFIAYGGLIHLALLVVSLTVNYGLLRLLSLDIKEPRRNALLAASVTFNLCFIGVFKYADFFIANVSALAGRGIEEWGLILPLAISFYTFQLIALTVAVWKREWRCPSFLTYALFVMFFPQLIAGPIVRLHEVQQSLECLRRLRADNVAFGLSIFSVGLFKKVVLADTLADHANLFFALVEKGSSPTLLEAWAGTLSYTFQIYFDFSGYSDMAIGLAWIFGIRLPANFFSPYKATSIIDFWRTWHMTLSRFLRDFLYIPLGGNRRGVTRRWTNVLLTMLIGGLWHGASWNFVLWGGFHGCLLALNNATRSVGVRVPRRVGWFLTFLAVAFAWVLFRTTETDDALRVYAGMLGLNGITLPLQFEGVLMWLQQWIPALQFAPSEIVKVPVAYILLLAGGVAFFLPNSEQIFRGADRPIIRLTPRWAMAVATIGFFALISTYQAQEFVYFQF